jgi:hypothetical protein
MRRRSDRPSIPARILAVGFVALAAMSAVATISTVEAGRAAASRDTTNEVAVHDSAFATLSTRAPGQIRVNDALRPAVAGTLPFVLGPLVLAFAGVVVASSAALKLCTTRVAIRRRAPPLLFA